MNRFHGIASMMLLLVAAIGCAGVKNLEKQKSVPSSEPRADQARQLLNQERDRADFDAAFARWEQQNDAQGCREGLEKLLARNPRHRDARLLLAEIFLVENDAQGAYAHVKAALDASPNDARVHFAMAMVLDSLGKTADSLGFYERASKMEPENESFSAAYQSARTAARGGTARPVVSAAGFSEATGDCPDFCVSKNGTVPFDRTTEMNARADSKNSAESADYAEIAASDNPQTPISAAAAAMRAGRPEDAVKLLIPAAQRFPNSAAVHRALGAAYYLAGDCQSSQVALQQALSLDKSSALSYLLMGRALAGQGQREAAETYFRQARELDPRFGTLR